jgi:hypothetical protein
MSSGNMIVYDKNTAQDLLCHEKLHKFEIWYCLFSKLNENVIWTCSDD